MALFAFEFPSQHTARRFISLPAHSVNTTREVKIVYLNGICIRLVWQVRTWHDTEATWFVNGTKHLDLACLALDANCWSGRFGTTGRVEMHSHGCRCDSMSICPSGWRTNREIKKHGCRLVRSRPRLRSHCCSLHQRPLPLLFGYCMICRLEQPKQGVDAQIQKGTASQVLVDV